MQRYLRNTPFQLNLLNRIPSPIYLKYIFCMLPIKLLKPIIQSNNKCHIFFNPHNYLVLGTISQIHIQISKRAGSKHLVNCCGFGDRGQKPLQVPICSKKWAWRWFLGACANFHSLSSIYFYKKIKFFLNFFLFFYFTTRNYILSNIWFI